MNIETTYFTYKKIEKLKEIFPTATQKDIEDFVTNALYEQLELIVNNTIQKEIDREITYIIRNNKNENDFSDLKETYKKYLKAVTNNDGSSKSEQREMVAEEEYHHAIYDLATEAILTERDI